MGARDQGCRLLRLQKVIACGSHRLHGRKAPGSYFRYSGITEIGHWTQERLVGLAHVANDRVQVQLDAVSVTQSVLLQEPLEKPLNAKLSGCEGRITVISTQEVWC